MCGCWLVCMACVANSIILHISRVFFLFLCVFMYVCVHLIGSHITIYCRHLMAIDKLLLFYVDQIPDCLIQTKYSFQ